MKIVLKPCPFCGANEVTVRVRDNDAWTECDVCKGKGGYIRMTKEAVRIYCKERAIEMWNRRADN